MKKLQLTARPDVSRILERLSEQAACWQGSWDVQLLGQGEQAHLFHVHRRAGASPQSVTDSVVIKVYRHCTAEDRRAFASEKECLELMLAAFPKERAGAWWLRSPSLVYTCEDPLALVMSILPGVSLERWLQSPQSSLSNCSALAQAVLDALQLLWAQQMIYGDLNLKNILYEPSQQTLGFLDPGLPTSSFRCDQVPRDWYPASRDLAYLLYSVAVSVKSTLNNPPARGRQLSFVKNLLGHFLETTVPASQRPQLLDEIRGCTQVHVAGIQCSWSGSGMWRCLVKRLTQRSLDRMLTQLAASPQGGRA